MVARQPTARASPTGTPLARLSVLVFDERCPTGFFLLDLDDLDNTCPEHLHGGRIEVDMESGVWRFFGADDRLAGEYQIGRGVRVPETVCPITGGRWGPAFVYRRNCVPDLEVLLDLAGEIRSGTLKA